MSKLSAFHKLKVSLVAKDAFGMLKGHLKRQADDFWRSTFARRATTKPRFCRVKSDGRQKWPPP